MTAIDNLTDEINRQLELYALQVRNDTEEISKTVAEQGVQKLKSTSPRRDGKYADGWAIERQGKVFVIYNKDRPSLTHLLEKGHASRSGGRVRAIPHIGKVETELIANFESELRRAFS